MSKALALIASSTGVTPEEVKEVLKGMIVSGKQQHNAAATDAEMTVVSSIFAKYDLNPFVREGHAFVSGGKLQVIIGLDGWLKIANRDPNFDGYEQIENFDDKGELISVTTKIYVKGRKYPTPHTEWMKEAFVPTSPAWKKYPFRMLAGKSLGQCIRKAFGISEILDDDEAARITSSRQEKDITPASSSPYIDWQAINDMMAECADLETLKGVAGGLRREMEINGTWAQHKDHMILLHAEHKERIEKAYSEPVDLTGEVVDAEFTDVDFGDSAQGE